jgi:DNA-binding SARP family transcriptional activator
MPTNICLLEGAATTARHEATRSIARHALLDSISDPGLAFVALIAPAGYGKSTVAQALAENATDSVVCDCINVKSGRDLAERVITAFADDTSVQGLLAQARLSYGEAPDASAWVDFALQVWQNSASSLAVIENAESTFGLEETRQLLIRILGTSIPRRTTVVCSRTALPFRLARFAEPHRIASLNADDLAFTRAEVRQLFGDVAMPEDAFEEIVRVTGGWPVAVLLFSRIAARSGVATVLEKLPKAADELYGYLVEEVLASARADVLRAMRLCAVVNTVTRDDLLVVMGGAVPADGSDFEDLPFVTSDGRVLCLHPLVADTLRRRSASECRAVAIDAAHGWEARGEAARAATFYLAAGNSDAAARALDSIPSYLFSNNLPDCAAVAAQLDVDTLCSYANLWGSTISFRTFTMSPEQHVHEAFRMWYGLPATASGEQRVTILTHVATALYLCGRVAEAIELLEEQIGRVDVPEQRGVLVLHLAAMKGLQGRFSDARALCSLGDAPLSPYGHGRVLDYVEAHSAFTHGDYERGFAAIDQSVGLARRSGMIVALAHTLCNGAIFAWMAGDDTRFTGYVAALEEVLIPGVERGFRFFVDCARGAGSASGDLALPNRAAIAFGHLFHAASAADSEGAAEAARTAARFADASCDPYIQTVAHVAVAILSPTDRNEALSAAAAAAGRIESEPMQRAVSALQSGRHDCGILSTVVSRMRRGERSDAVVRLDVLIPAIRAGAREVVLSEREMAVLILLAVHEHGLTRTRITDLLWPELDDEAAANNLKVHVYRIRRKLDDRNVVVTTQHGYALGARVEVEYRQIRAGIRALRGRTLSRSEAEWADGVRKQLQSERLDHFADQGWYLAIEREIGEAHREISMMLCRSALASGKPKRALEIAADVIARDPYDEAAREIVIHAYADAGEHGSAARELRRFRALLRDDLGADLSAPFLRSLAGLSQETAS